MVIPLLPAKKQVVVLVVLLHAKKSHVKILLGVIARIQHVAFMMLMEFLSVVVRI